MASPFDAIPDVAIDYVRSVFGAANEKVSTTMSVHPSMHEESLDHVLKVPRVFQGAPTEQAFYAIDPAKLPIAVAEYAASLGFDMARYVTEPGIG